MIVFPTLTGTHTPELKVLGSGYLRWMHVLCAPSPWGLPPGSSSPKVRPCLCREPAVSQRWWSPWCHGAAGCPRRDARNLWVRKPPAHAAPWHERWAAREAPLDSFLKISFSRPVTAWNLSGLDFFFFPLLTAVFSPRNQKESNKNNWPWSFSFVQIPRTANLD